jgi:hypothetical protein
MQCRVQDTEKRVSLRYLCRWRGSEGTCESVGWGDVENELELGTFFWCIFFPLYLSCSIPKIPQVIEICHARGYEPSVIYTHCMMYLRLPDRELHLET